MGIEEISRRVTKFFQGENTNVKISKELAELYKNKKLSDEIINDYAKKYNKSIDELEELFQIGYQKPLKFGQIHKIWYQCNPVPSKLRYGETCEILMESGRIGLYELVNIKWSIFELDWQYYTLKFVGYKRRE